MITVQFYRVNLIRENNHRTFFNCTLINFCIACGLLGLKGGPMTSSYCDSDRAASYGMGVSGTGGCLHLSGAAGCRTVMQPPLGEISSHARRR